jgi:hypothetical protein
MSTYTEFRPLWVPRPETKIAPTMLQFYENRSWWAQTKKNGTCTLIYARRNEIIYKTRHPDVNNGDHRLWKAEGDHNAFFAARAKWNVYVAELLHSKVSGGPKNELFIFDILVSDDEYLVGSTFAERQQLLHDRFDGKDEGDQVRIAPRITLAKCIADDFAGKFQNLKPEDEGLVLKDPTAKLRPCLKIDSNAGWQVKCRIPNANYSF